MKNINEQLFLNSDIVHIQKFGDISNEQRYQQNHILK